MWAPYVLLAAYAALNVPVTRALSSPLTVPMWRAAGGPLADSITYYLTPANAAAMAAVVIAAIVVPFAINRIRNGARVAATILVVAVAGLGPLAVGRVDARGQQRNAVTALLSTVTPRIAARTEQGDWRASPVAAGTAEDLSRAAGAAAGRNVVIVALESMAAQYLSFHGAADDPTPNLSAIAKQSLVFDAAYAAYPESIKGLFALLCSRAPAFDVPTDAHASAACAPLPKILASNGYRTALFHSGRLATPAWMIVGAAGLRHCEDAGAIGGIRSAGVDEPATVARMLKWIDALKQGERFVHDLPVAGHHPCDAGARPFTGRTEFVAYENALFDADRALGTLVGGLRARGLADRTLFVFIGDHGEAFNQHPGNMGHCCFCTTRTCTCRWWSPRPVRACARSRRSRRERGEGNRASISGCRRSLHEGASLLKPRERMALFETDYAAGWLGLRDRC
jgi:hypothetical protein